MERRIQRLKRQDELRRAAALEAKAKDRKKIYKGETFLLVRSDGVAVPVEVNDDVIFALTNAGLVSTAEPTKAPFRDENGNRLPNFGQSHTATNQQDVVDVVEDPAMSSLSETTSRPGARQEEHAAEEGGHAVEGLGEESEQPRKPRNNLGTT